METIKQPPHSGLCLMACCAMVTGKDLNYVASHSGPLGECSESGIRYMKLAEAIRYLASEKLAVGAPFSWPEPQNFEAGVELSAIIDTNENSALIVVPSPTRPGGMHQVVWDHEARAVRDPHWQAPELTPLEKCEIIEWLHLWRIEEVDKLSG